MPVLNSMIDDLIVGEYKEILRPITRVPAGKVLEQAWFTVKKKATDPETEALMKKSITMAATSDGQITNSGASGTGSLYFILTTVDTTKLKPHIVYVFDLWVKLTGIDPILAETGRLIAQSAITLERI